jgi:hypothetical protein
VALPTTLVLALAFLLASFPARNSDAWRHLATGRALFGGTYTPGTDPFAYTTDGVVWVNHAWLFDAALYTSYRVVGEPLLVLVKALLVAALAGLMLLAARPREGPWAASACVALALVALGAHLALGPAVVSYVLFAFTLWWLGRAERTPTHDRPLRTHWPLLVAFVVWANFDEWFLLGPLTVGLFWLGSVLSDPGSRDARPARGGGLLLVFVLSLAVCLLSPHHVRALGLPSLGAASPLPGFLAPSVAQIPVPLIAYGLLAVLGLLSLLPSSSRGSASQTLVWLALLGLSLYRGAAIPFFAIAAGPFLARNWQAAARDVPRPRAWLGPAVGTVALAALLVLACPGWLQGPFEPRGWYLHADPSLTRLAQNVAEWRRQGQLAAQARTFNLSPDVAHYLEWFCPGEKVFLDGRQGLFPAEVVAEYRQVRQALDEPASSGKAVPADDARAVLRRWHISHLLVADPSERRLSAALRILWQAPAEWTLVSLDGRATVFAWTDPQHGRPPAGPPPVDLTARAFGPGAATAPADGPGREPAPRPWWDCFARSDPPGAADRDEALVHLVRFEALWPVYAARNRTTWELDLAAAVLAVATPPHGPGAAAAGFPLAMLAVTQRPPPATGPTPLDLLVFESIAAHRRRGDDGPPGALLLAIRAARRSLRANPDDAQAYLRLSWAYERLHHLTAERAGGFPLLDQLRRVQIAVALKNALRLQPDLPAAHELLVGLYVEAGSLDLALTHLQEQLRLARAAGPRPGETALDFAARVEALAERERQLGMQVRERLNLVDTQAFSLGAYGKARLAQSNGLPGRALEFLQRSSYTEFGVEGAALQYYLLLYAGRTEEVRTWLVPDQEMVIGTFNYRWIQALLGAAVGDYARAGNDLQQLINPTVDLPELGVRSVRPGVAMGLALGQAMLRGTSRDPWQSRPNPADVTRLLEGLALTGREQADYHTLRGLLALEVGATDSARGAFRAALAAWDGTDGSVALARHYLALLPKG